MARPPQPSFGTIRAHLETMYSPTQAIKGLCTRPMPSLNTLVELRSHFQWDTIVPIENDLLLSGRVLYKETVTLLVSLVVNDEAGVTNETRKQSCLLNRSADPQQHF